MAALTKDDANVSKMFCMSEYVAETVFFLFKIGEALFEPSVRLYIVQVVCEQQISNDSSCRQ